jgi:cyclase
VVQAQNHPAVRFGRPDGWDALLAPLEALGARVVVPGHGPVGGPEAITLTRQYLAKLPAMAQADLLQEPFRTWGATDVWRQNVQYLGRIARE